MLIVPRFWHCLVSVFHGLAQWDILAYSLCAHLSLNARLKLQNVVFIAQLTVFFSKIGRSASQETTLQFIQSKCIPGLLYGLEACPTNKSDLRSLDFVIDRFFMKLFRTSNVAIVRQCQELFGFQLPSVTLCKRVDKFVGKYYASDNLLCKVIQNGGRNRFIVA